MEFFFGLGNDGKRADSVAVCMLFAWQFCWCPFWDGENVTLSKANRDLQRSGIKRSRLASPGSIHQPFILKVMLSYVIFKNVLVFVCYIKDVVFNYMYVVCLWTL